VTGSAGGIRTTSDPVDPGPPTEEDVTSQLTSVQVKFGNGTFQQATPTGSGAKKWATWSFVGPMASGVSPLTITAKVTLGTGPNPLTDQDSVSVRLDTTGPTLTISSPQSGDIVTLNGSQVVVPFAGNIKDLESGVKQLDWSRSGSTTVNPITPISSVGNWSVGIPFTQAGKQTIVVRATDNQGNVTTQEVLVDVALPFTSVDSDDVLSAKAYLSDLFIFAANRLSAAPGSQLLTDILCQRFNVLATSTVRAAATQPVLAARTRAEVLRTYLSKRLPSPPAAVQSLLTSGERAYARAAYDVLLLQMGTSYDELRLARSADDDTRAALATRLGLVALTPDLLDQLTLHPHSITEADLERVFGLTDTKRDLFPAQPTPVPEPVVLSLQRTQLRTLWQQQDALSPRPIIDPDVVRQDDVVSGSPAAKLQTDRQTFVQDRLDALRALRDTTLSKPAATQLAAFTAVVENVLGAGAVDQLGTLAADDKSGIDITVRLAAMPLERPAFRYLVRVQRLAMAGTVQENEWTDVFSILVQVQKVRLFQTWCQEERAKNLSLGPDFFKIADITLRSDPLPAWRATREDRGTFDNTLRARIDQVQSVRDTLAATVRAAETTALPLLRARLLDAIARATVPDTTKPAPASAEIAVRLGQELFVDFTDSGTALTSRIDQATEALQSLLFAVRTGRLAQVQPVLGSNPATGPAGWKLTTTGGYTETKFDDEWRSMGAHSTWRAAISVFFWPENVLFPSLRKSSTASWRALADRLRSNLNLTPAQARAEAATYLNDLRNEKTGSPPVPLPLPQALKAPAFVITEQLTNDQLAQRRDVLLAVSLQPVPPGETVGQTVALFNGVTSFAATPAWLAEVFYFVPMLLALQLEKSGQYLSAIDWLRLCYAYDLPASQRKIYRGLALEPGPTPLIRTVDWLLDGLNPHDIAAKRANTYTKFTVLTVMRCLLGFAGAEFTRETTESLPRARLLYETAQDLLGVSELTTPNTDATGKSLPLTPLLQASQLQASASLQKLRGGLNMLGLERVTSGRPTPYRYAGLIERAKQLANTSAQMEAAFLAALEKADTEAYNLLKARQDIEFTQAGVQLQELRVTEAEGEVSLAVLQRDRAELQREHFQQLVDEGTSGWEHAGLILSALGSVLSSALSGAGEAGPGAILGGLVGLVGAAGALISGESSFERRQEEWQQQLSLSNQDVRIGDQQIVLAQVHTDIVGQELAISVIQANHAQATLDFLANKFTNAEMFEWMSGVLGQVYSYFLNQATVLARLAERQLRFERQEELPEFIQTDYWKPPSEGALPGAAEGPDRRGLTGSARLLEAITQLDQYAFATDRRRLQLVRTVSLAALDPLSFQRFRESGVLRFQTPLAHYDREFPGHYLRLIRRVKTSVLALIPPHQGIRASLASAPSSRVVVDRDGFEPIVISHGSEEVALSSPINATGLFELDAQPELRTPFEGFGVDVMWELRMPKAANPFNYDTIADVLFTMEYTALNSKLYREQVIRTLHPYLSSERAFSFRDQFADQWYDLNNPDQTSNPLSVRFRTTRADFAPNLNDLEIQHIVLYFSPHDGATFELKVDHLSFTEDRTGETVTGEGAQSVDGIISTRRANGSAWERLIYRSPIGTWELALTDSQESRDLFKGEQIDNIVFVITYSGRAPAWPL
jgi:hypothetical protein